MRLVVIGGVAAGLSAASRARRLDKSLEIVVLEKGELASYGACGIPYYIEGYVRSVAQLVVYTPEYFERERNITVRTLAEAVKISHPRREVTLANGEKLHYDKLVIATGARPDRKNIEGADQPHVFTLTTIEDARRLKTFLETQNPRRAVVIGGGYIGLEAAEALRSNCLAVTVLTDTSDLLHRGDGELTSIVRAHLEKNGVELRVDSAVRAIERDRVNGVACDLVILATGLKPNTELAEEAGIEIGRTGAIRTDDRTETNLLGVFAAGDCAETKHIVTGGAAWIPLGTTANKMGRVAGACAAGARERFPGVVGTSIVRVCGLGVAFTGLSVSQARREGFSPVQARIEHQDRAGYFRSRPTIVELVADRATGRLLGGSVIGEHDAAGRINVIATALHNKMKADEFENLDLAYAPPYAPVWDPLLIAAQQLLKSL
jgi:NADPH-dependent 2,4-dienoyl-CoA reductase/sulfur reductase-like enzyme